MPRNLIKVTLKTPVWKPFVFFSIVINLSLRTQIGLFCSLFDHVIGRSRRPNVKDRSHLPYTEATLMECQRKGNIALFSVPRCTTEVTSLNGFTIPKGTWVFINRWGMHMSEKYWTNPETFDPKRFLGTDNTVLQPEAFVPFGVGKDPRSCSQNLKVYISLSGF